MLHTLLVGCIVALLKVNTRIYKLAETASLVFASFVALDAFLYSTIVPTSMMVAVGSIALTVLQMFIDVRARSHGMLLDTGFTLVCILPMIPISSITWLKRGDGSKHQLVGALIFGVIVHQSYGYLTRNEANQSTCMVLYTTNRLEFTHSGMRLNVLTTRVAHHHYNLQSDVLSDACCHSVDNTPQPSHYCCVTANNAATRRVYSEGRTGGECMCP